MCCIQGCSPFVRHVYAAYSAFAAPVPSHLKDPCVLQSASQPCHMLLLLLLLLLPPCIPDCAAPLLQVAPAAALLSTADSAQRPWLKLPKSWLLLGCWKL